MGNLLDIPLVPTGQVQISVNLLAPLHITAVSAQRKVNAFLATHIGNLLMADEAALTITDRIVWRIPVNLMNGVHGRVGRVGDIDVDIQTGELLLNPTQIHQLEQNAIQLTQTTPLPPNRNL
jgi:hypothetical protein